MKQKISLWTTLFLMVMAIVLPEPVMANGSTFTWIWTVDFVGNQAEATLVLHEHQAGAVVQEVLIDFSKTCVAIGPVPIQNGEAHFNGQGYIECVLPDIADAILTHFGVSGMPSIISSDRAWASAELIGPSVGSIFAYDTMSFEAELQSDFATSTLNIDGIRYQQMYQGQNYSQPGQTHQLWVGNQPEEFLDHIWNYPTVGSWTQPYQTLPSVAPGSFPSQNLAYLDNGSWQGTNQSIGAFNMTTGKTVITIGFDPITGQQFNGILSSVGADPGCRGN